MFFQAFDITQRVCAYTNHTILPEALERWPVSMLENLLPRHLEIIYKINHFHMENVAQRYNNNGEKMRVLSIVEEEGGKRKKSFKFFFLKYNQSELKNAIMKIVVFWVKDSLL